MFYEVIPGKVFGKAGGVLTYESDNSLVPGQIVVVPLGRGKAVGVVSKKVAQPDFATKKILQVLYSTPLPAHLVATAKFVAEYYQVPLASTLGLILPNGVDKRRRKTEQMFGNNLMTTGPGEASRLGSRRSRPSPRGERANSRAAALRNAPESNIPTIH